MEERLQKLMAQANIGSRRACEEIIQQGRVRVNGKMATLGDKADPEKDVVTVDGERLKIETKKRYIVFNKPMNVLSTTVRERGDERPTVRELIPVEGHLFTIGRLDADSEGLMVLTNDGELANKLAHPRYGHTKTYKVVVYGNPSQDTLDRWEKGVFLEEGLTSPCSIRVQSRDDETTTLRIVMIEGKKRQIRRVAGLMGHPVKKLTRTFIGKLGLGTLKRGQFYDLSEEEVAAMLIPADDLSYIRKLRRERHIRRASGAPEEVIPREDPSVPTLRRPAPTPDQSDEGRRIRRSLVKGDFRRREESDDRPPRREFDRDRPRSADSSDRPPRREFDRDRPRRSDDSDDRPPRRPSSRPPARSGDSEDRPARRPSSKPPARSGDSEDRPKRRPSSRPPSRSGTSSDRPARKPVGKPGSKPSRPGGGNRPSNQRKSPRKK